MQDGKPRLSSIEASSPFKCDVSKRLESFVGVSYFVRCPSGSGLESFSRRGGIVPNLGDTVVERAVETLVFSLTRVNEGYQKRL